MQKLAFVHDTRISPISVHRTRGIRRHLLMAGLSAALTFFALTTPQRAQAEIEPAPSSDRFQCTLSTAALLARLNDYAAAWQRLQEGVRMDADISADRRNARNLLAGLIDLQRGSADAVYRGADAGLRDAALSPDGRWLVAAGERGTLVVFDAAEGTIVARLAGHDPDAAETGSVRAIAFNTAGDRLFSAGDDGRILVWSVPDWQQQDRWQVAYAIYALALSPDGSTLATGGSGEVITVRSTADGTELAVLRGATSSIADGNALAWLDDSQLVSGGFDGQVGLWDVQTATEQTLARVHTDRVNSVAVSADGALIASGDGSGRILLWDTQTQLPLRQLTGHRSNVLGLRFDASGKRLLSAGRDNDLRLWDVASGVALRVYQGHMAGLWSVAIAGGMAYSAADDGTVRGWPISGVDAWIWDLADTEPTAVALSLNAGQVLLGLGDGSLRVYALPNDRADTAPADVSDPNHPGALLAEDTKAHGGAVQRIAISADANTLATAGADRTAGIWQMVRPGFGLELQLSHRLRGHRAGINAVAFSADGKRLATAGSDGRIGLFDVASGDGVFSDEMSSEDQVQSQPGSIAALTFTPDGQSLLSADYDAKTLSRWSIQKDSPSDPITLATPTDNPLWVSLSPNADEIATAGRQQFITRHSLLDADTPATDSASQSTPLVGHESTVYRVAYTPDGKLLLSVSADRTVRLWDLSSNQLLYTLPLPTRTRRPAPLWDFDFRCTADQRSCWLAVPLAMGRLALYRLPYAQRPGGLDADTADSPTSTLQGRH